MSEQSVKIPKNQKIVTTTGKYMKLNDGLDVQYFCIVQNVAHGKNYYEINSQKSS